VDTEREKPGGNAGAGISAPTSEERALLHYVRRMPWSLRTLELRFLRGLYNIYVSSEKPTH